VIQALVVSNIVLWLMVVALAALVLALMRQIGVLNERVAPAGALVGSHGPAVGEPGPVVDVETWDGRALRIGGEAEDTRDTLLFIVSPTCPVCKVLLPVVDSISKREQRSLRIVLASDGERPEHESFVAEHSLDRETYVLSRELGLRYEVGKLPYAVLLDPDGTIRAKGLVNSREHFESLFEAKERGVASLQEYLGRRLGDDDNQRVA
jgi:methylamine dehydrogenase accessory protein MauD